jgi:hypothetical protein
MALRLQMFARLHVELRIEGIVVVHLARGKIREVGWMVQEKVVQKDSPPD